MPENTVVNQTIAAWRAHAEADRRAVSLCLAGPEPLPGVAAFHCQQAIEKLLKALLVQAGIPFRKTHNLIELGDAAAKWYPSLAPILRRAEHITLWAVAYRYPAEEAPEAYPDNAAFEDALALIEEFSSVLAGSAHNQTPP